MMLALALFYGGNPAVFRLRRIPNQAGNDCLSASIIMNVIKDDVKLISMYDTDSKRIDERCYSLGEITAKLKNTSETMNYLSVLILNLRKRLRLLLRII